MPQQQTQYLSTAPATYGTPAGYAAVPRQNVTAYVPNDAICVDGQTHLWEDEFTPCGICLSLIHI